MSDTNKYYKIGAIVDQHLLNKELGDGWFQKCLSWALYGLTELHLDSWNDVKTCLLPVTDRKTVVLPNGFVDWSKVGVRRGQYVVTLGVNDDLNLLQRTIDSPTVSGLLSQNLPNGLSFDAYANYVFSNFDGTSFSSFGTGFPSKGHFKVFNNGNCKELLMDYDYAFTEVYVEYITDGFDPCSETVLHPYYRNYILKYIEAMYEENNNPMRTEASIDRKWSDVFWAEKKVRSRKNDLDPRTLMTINRAQTRLTPKM
jgi:hypothetical protein